MSSTAMMAPTAAASGITLKDEFTGTSIERRAETATAAVAAQATAEIQAMYVVARQCPRNWLQVRSELLQHCQRTGFAEKARYGKPMGGKTIVGPSIRFAETCLQSMGNVRPKVSIIFDDPDKRVVQVSVTDLEKNVTHSSEIVIEKTVERKSVKTGQTIISQRPNSMGEITFLVGASEDELRTKQAALVSKELRTHALRIVPSDIIEECMERVVETLEDSDSRDPTASKKKLADAFMSIGVSPIGLQEYLGHSLETVSPAETVALRALFAAIKDGETTWNAALESNGKSTVVDAVPMTGSLKERMAKKLAKTEPIAAVPHDPVTGEVLA